MGKRLQPDHPGIARIKQLFEDHFERLDAEAQRDPAFDLTLNTTTFEKDKLQVIGELPSNNGMDKYNSELQLNNPTQFVRDLDQAEIELEKLQQEKVQCKFIDAATRSVDRAQDLARERREARGKALDEAKGMKY